MQVKSAPNKHHNVPAAMASNYSVNQPGKTIATTNYMTCRLVEETDIGMAQSPRGGTLDFWAYLDKGVSYHGMRVTIRMNENYEIAVTIFQSDINRLSNWFAENNIFVNSKKTKLLCFRNPHKRVLLNRSLFLPGNKGVQDTELKYEASTKYLGLNFDEHMTWECHIDCIKKRLRTVSSFIYRIGTSACALVKKNIYCALGESILRYGILIYGSSSNNRLRTVDKLIYRIVNNIAYGTQFQHLDLINKLEAFNIMPLNTLFRYIAIITNYFSRTEYKHPVKKRPLRNIDRYYLPRINTHYGKRMRSFYVPYIFNKIPEELISLDSLKEVKNKFRTWCLQNQM